ncbi:MAG: hypothetical protein ACRES7_00560 [Gammaproteobacteria bacterium]
MNKHMLLFQALLLAVPVVALAAGQTGAPRIVTSSAAVKGGEPVKLPVPAFSKVDTNKDNQIEWKEAQAVGVPKSLFERFDYRHDGKLTLTEWKMVEVAMIHTQSLPATNTSLPPVPASIVKKVIQNQQAPHHGTAAGTTAAPQPSSG